MKTKTKLLLLGLALLLSLGAASCKNFDLDPDKGELARTRRRWPPGQAPTNAVPHVPHVPAREPLIDRHWQISYCATRNVC
jgi:hypothetical protein